MIRFTAIVAAALAATAAVPADARPVTATWHPDKGADGRYCVRSTHLEAAAMTGTRIYQRACRSERAWRALGVTFARLPRRS